MKQITDHSLVDSSIRNSQYEKNNLSKLFRGSKTLLNDDYPSINSK